MRVIFYTTQVSTKDNGAKLPDDAVIDKVEPLSMGEYVKVSYHIVRENKPDEPESTQEA